MVNHPNRKRRPFKVSVELHSGGGWASYCAEFYSDDDDASGYGDNAMQAFWYGTRQECEAIKASGKQPKGLHWHPMGGCSDRKSGIEMHETHADNH